MGLWRSSAGCASRAGHPEAAAGGTGGLAARALCALPALLHAAQHPAPPPAARAGAGPAAGAGLGAGAAKQRRSTAACRVPGLAPVQRQLQADLRSSAVSSV
ncbi:hypothetical protein OEZ86_010779 [Tetradesmus obliquus]|nr:hypothetical protein OEZ86_010779 [Tetradesmus obliquus]